MPSNFEEHVVAKEERTPCSESPSQPKRRLSYKSRSSQVHGYNPRGLHHYLREATSHNERGYPVTPYLEEVTLQQI